MLPVGSKIGKYTVVRLLGSGGMGTVHLVRHDVLDAYFALKVLAADVASRNAQFIPRFLREAKLCCKIRHPNLVSVHDAGRDDATGLYYLVMDYAPGGSLREAMESADGPFDCCRALKIVREIASALVTASEFGMVHRDIKPENIMFGPDGEAKLADLGIAKASDDSTLVTMENAVFGTPAYMSPEQACDAGKVDARADLYSLGVVLFEMLSGRRPYTGSSSMSIIAKVLSQDPVPDVRTVRGDIPDKVAKLVRDMCAKDVSKRIQSASALLDRIAEIDGNVPGITPVEGCSVRRRGVEKTVVVSVVIGVAVLSFVIMLIIGLPRPPGPQPNVNNDPINNDPVKEPPEGKGSGGYKQLPDHTPITNVWPVVTTNVIQETTNNVRQSISGKSQIVDDPVEMGKPVVIGSESDDPAELKKLFGASAFVKAENSNNIMSQVEKICEKEPSMLYLKFGGNDSLVRNDGQVKAVANMLRDRNANFEFVLEDERNPKAQNYNQIIRDICQKCSFPIFSKRTERDEKH